MKKKFWLVAILAAALILLLGAAALASGSTCEHSWTINGDSTHTCVICDVTEPCSGGSATCTQRAVCSFCGGEYGEGQRLLSIPHHPQRRLWRRTLVLAKVQQGRYVYAVHLKHCTDLRGPHLPLLGG